MRNQRSHRSEKKKKREDIRAQPAFYNASGLDPLKDKYHIPRHTHVIIIAGGSLMRSAERINVKKKAMRADDHGPFYSRIRMRAFLGPNWANI